MKKISFKGEKKKDKYILNMNKWTKYIYPERENKNLNYWPQKKGIN